MKKPVVIAHRGASAYAPENTMISFEKALKMGTGGIELDIHLSKDGHMPVIHDPQIDRTSNGKGWIKDYTIDELRGFDFGSWFSGEYKGERIPVLEEVLELISGRDILLDVEIKSGPIIYNGIEQRLASLLRKFGILERTIVSSFNHYSLFELKRIEPEVKIGLLYEAGLFEPWDYAKKLKAYAIHPLYFNIVPEIVNGCKAHNIAVNPFTVDQPELIRKIALAGVDGIITNVPDIAVKVINEIGG